MVDVLTFVLDARDHISRVMDRAGDASDRLAKRLLKLGAIGGAAPIGANVVAGVGAMTAAFASAGLAAGAFGVAVQPQIKLMAENARAAEKVAKAQETAANKQQVADMLRAKGHALAEKAQKAATTAKLAAIQAENQYTRQTKGLPKATGDAALALAKLKLAHEGWSKSLAGDTMPLFTRGLNAARRALPMLTPLVKTAAGAFTDFANSGDKTGGFKRFIDRMNQTAKTTLPALLNSGRNVFRGLGGIINAFLPSSEKFSGGMERATAAFARWGKGLRNSEGFRKFMDSASAGGSALGNLAVAAGKLLSALSPILGTTSKLATAFANFLNWLPPETLAFIAGALLGIKVATLGWAGAQALLNIAMAANPVGLIVAGLVLLGAALVTAWKKSQFFREVVTDAFAGLASPMLEFAKIALKVQREVWMGTLDFADSLLGLGEKAFSWVPGVGDKLATARSAVDLFKGGVERGMNKAIEKVDGWKAAVDRMPLEMRLKGDITDLEKKINSAKRQLSDKNLPPGKRAKLTANIDNWNRQLVLAKANLQRTPAARKAMLTGDIRDWSAKIASAKRQLSNKNLPPGKRAQLTATIADLQSKVMAAKAALASVKDRYVTLTTHYRITKSGSVPAGTYHGSTAGRSATGGLIRGPGTSTSDSIPRWLSDGEYVIRASSVSKYGPEFLAAINEGRLGAAQPAVAGVPSARPARSSGGQAAPVIINVNGALDPTAVGRQIVTLLTKYQRDNGGGPLTFQKTGG